MKTKIMATVLVTIMSLSALAEISTVRISRDNILEIEYITYSNDYRYELLLPINFKLNGWSRDFTKILNVPSACEELFKEAKNISIDLRDIQQFQIDQYGFNLLSDNVVRCRINP